VWCLVQACRGLSSVCRRFRGAVKDFFLPCRGNKTNTRGERGGGTRAPRTNNRIFISTGAEKGSNETVKEGVGPPQEPQLDASCGGFLETFFIFFF